MTVSAALLATAAAAALAAAAADPGEALRANVAQAQTLLLAHMSTARARTGFAEELRGRLRADIGLLDEAARPAWSSEDEFWSYNSALVDLDVALVHQATAGSPIGLPSVRSGLAAGFVRTGGSGAQPVSVYVPPRHAVPAPLIVMLHGGAQTETQLLAFDALRRLADENGAILVAPWAHGELTAFDAIYQADVDAAADAARNAYAIDPHRMYLFGMSAGAFGAFHAALAHPKRWAGILAVGGSLGAEDTPQAAALRDNRIYVVSGVKDAVIPSAFIRTTLTFMRGSGLNVAHYEEMLGEHSLHSLLPSVRRAWRDMVAGALPPQAAQPTPVRSATPSASAAPLPSGSAAPPTPVPQRTQAP